MSLPRNFVIHLGSPLLFLFAAHALAGDLTISIEERIQRSVHDTVVELVGTDTQTAPVDGIEIVQRDKEYLPEMSVIPRGTPVLFNNQDALQHHVYSVSKGNSFDLPLFKGTPAKKINFDTPGVAKMGCNIHDWMLAFVYVNESKYTAITDASGRAHFSDLPEGEYLLQIWNPRLRNNKKVISQSISVTSGQPLEHTVTLSLRKTIRKPKRKEESVKYD